VSLAEVLLYGLVEAQASDGRAGPLVERMNPGAFGDGAR
jgi:hypothetical protein